MEGKRWCLFQLNLRGDRKLLKSTGIYFKWGFNKNVKRSLPVVWSAATTVLICNGWGSFVEQACCMGSSCRECWISATAASHRAQPLRPDQCPCWIESLRAPNGVTHSTHSSKRINLDQYNFFGNNSNNNNNKNKFNPTCKNVPPIQSALNHSHRLFASDSDRWIAHQTLSQRTKHQALSWSLTLEVD